MRVVTWLLTTALALAVATWVMPGIYFTGPHAGSAEIQHKLGPLLLVAVVLGVVSLLVKPLVKFVSCLVIVLTLGLFLFVINALMLMLTAWIAGQLGIGFHVDGFWQALIGGLIITIVNLAVGLVIDDDADRQRRRPSYR